MIASRGTRRCRIGLVVGLLGAVCVGVVSRAQDEPSVDPLPEPQIVAPAPTEEAAGGSLASTLEAAIGRANDHLARLDEFAANLQEAREAEATARGELVERAAAIAGEVQLYAPGSPELADLYRRIVSSLEQARPRLAAALDLLRAPSKVPRDRTQLDTAELDAPSVRSLVDRLREQQARIVQREAELIREERLARLEAVEARGSGVERLDELRIETLGRLGPAGRRQLLGLSRAGIAQLGREIDHLRLMVRLWAVRWLQRVERAPSMLADLFAVGSATWRLVKVLGLILLSWYAWRRGKALEPASRKMLARAWPSRTGRRRADRVVYLLRAVVPWGAFLVAVRLLRGSLGPLASWGEVDLLLRVLVFYGIYRLSIDLLVAVTLSVARRYRLAVDAGRTAQVLRSARSLMRVVMGIAVVLVLSESVLGRGYLFEFVVRISWIFFVGVALVLLARWRRTIAEAYLDVGGSGRLAGLVRRTRDRWYGLFVSAAAFVLLAGHALVRVGRDFAMGFEQTRRALAFLFRRKVEKQAERTGYAEGRVEQLPEKIRESFSEAALADSNLAADRFPGYEQLAARMTAWSRDEASGSFLLTGEQGSGKTSWLACIDAGEFPLSRISLVHRPRKVSRLVSVLSDELRPEEGAVEDLGGLRKALLAGPRRVVVLDNAQNLFLGTVGGYDTFEQFASFVEATSSNVFWICSVSGFAWEHLFAVRPDLMVFRDRQVLAPWSEEQIRELIQVRLSASGVECIYDGLLVESLEDWRSRTLRAEEGYARLLWDYSDGNPRVALHYWLRSLVPESDNRVRVRLFRAPGADDLAALGERAHFLLAAIVVHENLTLAEAAEVTRYPLAICRLQLERLRGDELLRRDAGRYRVSTHWHRAIIRQLRRSNLLPY